MYLFIFYFTSKALVSTQERRAQNVGAGRAIKSTHCSHLLSHKEELVCRGQGGCKRSQGKARRELGLGSFSNSLLSLRAEGPEKPGCRKGGHPSVGLESRFVELRSSYPGQGR